MSMSPEYASDISSEFPTAGSVNVLPYHLDTPTSLRRSGRARSNEQDSPTSDTKAKKMRMTNLRLPRGVQRQSRNGAAYSGWVTVEGYRLLGPARPTAELASLDRERLAEAKLVGGLPEARKVIQQLHAEVASTRRIKSQYLSPNYNLSVMGGHHTRAGSNSAALNSSYYPLSHSLGSSIQLRSGASNLSATSRYLPRSVSVITPCGSRDNWSLRCEKFYASFVERTDLVVETAGVFVLEFGALRQTIDEARADAEIVDEDDKQTEMGGPVSSTSAEGDALDESPGRRMEENRPTGTSSSVPVDVTELLTISNERFANRSPISQESVWGFCAVAELVLQNKTAYVGLCVFCDIILTAGPARGARSSAESDAFSMISEVLASGITYAASHYVVPLTINPAEDLFLGNALVFAEEGQEEFDEATADEDEKSFKEDGDVKLEEDIQSELVTMSHQQRNIVDEKGGSNKE